MQTAHEPSDSMLTVHKGAWFSMTRVRRLGRWAVAMACLDLKDGALAAGASTAYIRSEPPSVHTPSLVGPYP